MTGHCEHCADWCDWSGEWNGTFGFAYRNEHVSTEAWASWGDGLCPACAERERIAQRLEREAADKQEDLYDRAAAIARGDA